MRAASLEGVEVLLSGFVARIIKQANDTDRALRGGGNPQSVEVYNSTGNHSGANAQIHRLADAHRLLMAQSRPKPTAKLSLRQRFETWYAENKATAWVIGISVGVILTLGKAFLF